MTRVLPLLILIGLIASGCASIGKHPFESAILVRTEPPGATIRQHGRVIGISPAYVAVERGRRVNIEIASKAAPVQVAVKTHYRWADSFASNFIFYIFAPIGWATDLLTGTAWEPETPPSTHVTLTDQDQAREKNPKPKVIAIAPPLADQIALSDNGGEAIQRTLESRRKTEKILPYEETLPKFLNAGYDYDGAPSQDDRNWLYYTLGADLVYESIIETVGDHLVLRSQERSAVGGQVKRSFDLDFDPDGTLAGLYTKNVWWSRLLPDTATLDFVSSQIHVDYNGTDLVLQPSANQDWFSTASTYLGALNITSLPGRRYGRAARFTFTLIPLIRVSRKQVTAPSSTSAGGREGDQDYSRWLLSGGYGPEFGWQVSRHYLYFNVVPILNWSEIHWSTDGQRHSVTNTNFQASVEAGYIFYFSQNWNLRLFTRTQNEDAAGWSEALASRDPTNATTKATSVSTQVSGLSVGYRFEPAAHLRKDETRK